MPAEIVTVGFCPQYFATFSVKGSGSNTYTVTLNGSEAPAHCTCPAYKYSTEHDCKHIRAVWEHGCLYNPQWKDAGPNDLAAQDIFIEEYEHQNYTLEPCKGCGKPTTPVRIAV